MPDKKIYFYRFTVTSRKANVSHPSIENYFKNTFKNINPKYKIGETFTFTHENDDIACTFDATMYDTYLTFRVGKPKDTTNVVIRDGKEVHPVIPAKELARKHLEVCSYYRIDFAHGICASLGGAAAPTMEDFSVLINNLSSGYILRASGIFTQAAIEMLSNNNSEISKVSMSVRTPDLSALDHFGFSKSTAKALEEFDAFELTLQIKAKPRKSMVKAKDKIAGFINAVRKEPVEIKNTVSCVAKIGSDRSKEYNFVESKFYLNTRIDYIRNYAGIKTPYTIDEVTYSIFTNMKKLYENNSVEIHLLAGIDDKAAR